MKNSIEMVFLNELKGKNVRVFVSNGYKEEGRLIGFDEIAVVIQSKVKQTPMVLYKSHISGIAPTLEDNINMEEVLRISQKDYISYGKEPWRK